MANKLIREDSLVLPDGFVIEKGEIFKIKGKNSFGVSEHGGRFKFDCLVTNVDLDVQWVECYQMFRGHAGAMRAFPLDRVKRIPKRRRRRGPRKTDS